MKVARCGSLLFEIFNDFDFISIKLQIKVNGLLSLNLFIYVAQIEINGANCVHGNDLYDNSSNRKS